MATPQVPPTPTPYVRGGRFLAAYRKLAARLEDLDPSSSAQRSRTPKQDGCETLPCWAPHAFAYVLGSSDEDMAFEIAAALAQFEPVTMAIEGRQAYVRARRSLPDHVRLVQLFDVPDQWTATNPVSFAHALAGDLRVVEYNCADAPAGATPSLMRQICEIERIHRYGGPELRRGETLAPEQAFVEVNGRGQVLLSPGDEEDGQIDAEASSSGLARPNDMTVFADGQRSVVCFPHARFSQDGGIIVPRTTSKASADALRAQLPVVHELDQRYMGFYLANGGILVPAYGKKEIDLRAMKVLTKLFPKRRVVQIQTSRSLLNINEFVLGFPGAKPRAAPASAILRASAALTQMNQAQQEVLQKRLVLDRKRTRVFSLRLHDDADYDNEHDDDDRLESGRSVLASAATGLSTPLRLHTGVLESAGSAAAAAGTTIEWAVTTPSHSDLGRVLSSGSSSFARRDGLQLSMHSRERLLSQETGGPRSEEIERASSRVSETGSTAEGTGAPVEPPLDADAVGLAEDPQDNFTFTEPPPSGQPASRLTSTLGSLARKASTWRSRKTVKEDEAETKGEGPSGE